MRLRQAILLTIGALGAGLFGASIHGVATVNADLERMVPVRHQIDRTLLEPVHRDCDRNPLDGEQAPAGQRSADDQEI